MSRKARDIFPGSSDNRHMDNCSAFSFGEKINSLLSEAQTEISLLSLISKTSLR